ncbi:MAG TPA: flagellar transcriptional regulator FlhD [Ramlibacter sp.]|jgi:flagellar transcriptional activator FlhD|uniref:flagellar transcriptional regulator FlhD n=1 Tax=Ramlibacter sp. TaxID=1917967 RepID=UPI002D6F513F|nr:flagellar transcriptional regulator FlhD [Ramlibacter sp.]HZY19146.1 flagellar transcriptional regulator FlhD [Ramlibacter sp.]
MPTEQLSNEIRELNLSYLMLAQTMIRSDKAQALFRLGLSEDVCDLIAAMSPQQLLRVASRNLMLCAMRFDDSLVWNLLTERHSPRQAADSTASRLHASVLMAGRAPAAA